MKRYIGTLDASLKYACDVVGKEPGNSSDSPSSAYQVPGCGGGDSEDATCITNTSRIGACKQCLQIPTFYAPELALGSKCHHSCSWWLDFSLNSLNEVSSLPLFWYFLQLRYQSNDRNLRISLQATVQDLVGKLRDETTVVGFVAGEKIVVTVASRQCSQSASMFACLHVQTWLQDCNVFHGGTSAGSMDCKVRTNTSHIFALPYCPTVPSLYWYSLVQFLQLFCAGAASAPGAGLWVSSPHRSSTRCTGAISTPWKGLGARRTPGSRAVAQWCTVW